MHLAEDLASVAVLQAATETGSATNWAEGSSQNQARDSGGLQATQAANQGVRVSFVLERPIEARVRARSKPEFAAAGGHAELRSRAAEVRN